MASNSGSCRQKSSSARKTRRRLNPYAWLGTGAVSLGIGAAALAGAGAAHADDGPGESSPSASSSSEGSEPSSSRASSRQETGDTGDTTDDHGPAGSDPTDPSPTTDTAESEPEQPDEPADSGTVTKRRDRRASEPEPETTHSDPPPADAAVRVVVDDPHPSADALSTAAANTPPSATASRVGSPGWLTGRVTGHITAADADGDRLTFTGVTTARGTVAVTARGAFTYTPTAAARHAAASTESIPAADSDTFLITVTDGRGGVGTVPVAVQIRPTNSAPSRLRFTAAQPDPSTSRVIGAITATDRDGDTFTYRTATAPDGSVSIGSDGTFTYTPSPAARLRARTTWYNDTDRFSVAVDDGHGATRTIAVRVRVAPSNFAPVAGTPTIGTPDAATGAVIGSVHATDPDGDSIAYTVSTPPSRGRLTIGGGGVFTYTPNTDARHAAATGQPGTTTDTVTVTASDTLGAATSILLTVGILPRNSAPTNARATVGQPDSLSGVVTGTVRADDADGDALTYSGPAATVRGHVHLTGAGTFAYTPTPAALQAAAAAGAPAADRTDTFVVTVDDGHGGVAAVPVSVAIGLASPPPDPPPPGPPSSALLPAFPGAEGFGAMATGGRGGSVVYVTTTNASGVGSLQWAIEQPGAKYILFKVSGVIDIQIHLTNSNVTIAGQTSPGGITIRGLVTDETPYQDQAVRAPSDFAENWILQHIRIRPGLNGPSDDGLRLRYTRNAIVDHVSIGNATDEAVEISYSNNITIQNSILAETLGGHSFYGGVLMNYSNPAYGFGLDNIGLHHNVFSRIEGRLPEGSRESLAAANSTMNLELSNNLYWDPRFFIALGADTNVVTNGRGDPYPIYWNLNAVNNFFRTGPQFPYGMFDDQMLRVGGNRLFVSGNMMSRYPDRSDYDLFYCCNDYGPTTQIDASSHRAQKLTSRHPFPAITYTPTGELRTVLGHRAGAWPRDPMDRRLLESIADEVISSAGPNTNPAGDGLLPPYSGLPPAAPLDTDNDGMPDAWEITRGLNPASANHNGTTLSTQGYTDLEVYLHELSARLVDPG